MIRVFLLWQVANWRAANGSFWSTVVIVGDDSLYWSWILDRHSTIHSSWTTTYCCWCRCGDDSVDPLGWLCWIILAINCCSQPPSPRSWISDRDGKLTPTWKQAVLTTVVHPHPHRRHLHPRTSQRSLTILVHRLSTHQTRSLNPPINNRHYTNLAMRIQSLGCTMHTRIHFGSLLCPRDILPPSSCRTRWPGASSKQL